MKRACLERPEVVFMRVPDIEDICIEFGIDRTDAETITCMYEVYRRITEADRTDERETAYSDGYRDGYNDAIEEATSMVDSVAWEIGSLKKN